MLRLLALSLLWFLAACAAPAYKRPAMTRKGREAHVAIYGWNLPWKVQEAMVEGRVIPGMPYDWLQTLYGPADLTICCPRVNLVCDSILVYQANNTVTVGSASVRADTVVHVTGQLAQPQRF